MHLTPGQRLGDYRIVEPLGAGGMGEVYRARDVRLERDVAVKVLPRDVAADPARRARFEREARSVAALNHENIVTIHAIGETGDDLYLAMELVEGETLDRRIPEDGMPTGALLDLAVPVASALAAAHARGIVHRDLKPANVMVTHDGKVKVLDFGLAKLIHAAEDDAAPGPADQTRTVTELLETREGAIVGTVPYMSPEQLSGRPAGPASDLFAMGVMLYELATGSRPFRGKSSTELISSILTGEPAPVRELRPALPDALGGLIGTCLAKSPAGRPSSAEQLRRDLEALRSGASPTGLTARSAPPRGTRGRWVAAAAVLLALVAGTLGWRALRPAGGSAAAGMPKVAVLPFVVDGGERATYAGGGLADEIARRLSGLRSLAVVPAGDATEGSDPRADAAAIGRELDLDYVLVGTVGDEGDRLRVTPSLVRVADGSVAWSDTYDAAADDVQELQSDIASRVVRELGVTLSARERDRLSMRSTDSVVAYEAYLRGVEAQPHSHDSEPEYRRALRLFEQAVSLDPDFALAWLGVAHNHLQLYWLGYDRTEARLKQSWDALERAGSLAPDLADVKLQRGYYHYHASLDFDAALAELSAAAADIPNDPELIRTIGYIWRRQGLFEQAIENLERARELTPFEPYQNTELAYTRLFVRDYDEAFREIEAIRRRDPNYDWAYMLAAFTYWHRGLEGDLDRARAELARHPDPRDDYPAWFRLMQHMYDRDFEAAQSLIANLAVPMIKLQSHVAPRDMLAGLTYLAAGDADSARPRLESALVTLRALLEELPDDHRVLSALGLCYAGLGMKDEAVAHGRRAVEAYPVSEDALMGPDRLWDLARIYVLVGEHEQALDQIAYLLSLRTHYSAAMLDEDPVLDPLRSHPRYAVVMRGA